ncbi:MAG: aminopeptidase [Roseivirga sp.]|nr:aminopeptidase [Roseivirga sp.]
MKKWFKRIGLGLLSLILIVYLLYFELANYGLMQLRGQLNVVNNAVPLEEFLEMPETTDEQRFKVGVIREARTFAFDSLGINYSDNYTKIFDQEDKPSMYVVTACEPFEFKARLWKFPVVGSVPYKGFFSREKAMEEARSIKAADSIDVSVRTAGGWSTLGWFNDPVLSNMLKRSEGDLASLIIHELTHGTLYIKDSVTFNENLASFIGDKGAVLFLEAKYGKGAAEVDKFLARQADEELFKSYMLFASKKLDSTYTAIVDFEKGKKQEIKDQVIEDIRSGIDTVSFMSDRYKGYFEKYKPNNTFFMSFLRYNSQLELLEEELNANFEGDLKKFLIYLKETYPSV